MNTEETKEKVISSIQRLSNASAISDSNTLEEIGITSLKFIRLVVDIEKKCEMRFDDQDIDSKLFYTVNDLIMYVKNKSKQNLLV